MKICAKLCYTSKTLITIYGKIFCRMMFTAIIQNRMDICKVSDLIQKRRNLICITKAECSSVQPQDTNIMRLFVMLFTKVLKLFKQ